MKINEVVNEGFWDDIKAGASHFVAGAADGLGAGQLADQIRAHANTSNAVAAADPDAVTPDTISTTRAAKQAAAAAALNAPPGGAPAPPLSPEQIAQKRRDKQAAALRSLNGTHPPPVAPAPPPAPTAPAPAPALPVSTMSAKDKADLLQALTQMGYTLADANNKIASLPPNVNISTALRQIVSGKSTPATESVLSQLGNRVQLTEGGNVFDDVTAIKKEYVPGIITKIKSLMPPGIEIIPHIGSAGFKVESGDMDVFVDAAMIAQHFNAPDDKLAKVALKKFIETQGYVCALSGRNVHVRMPVPGGTFVQVDVMVIPDAARVAPFHQHGDFKNNLPGQYADPEFKGGQLFVMYSSLSKALGLKFSPFEGKLVDRNTNQVIATDKDSVAKILLNKNATAADLASVKTIMRALAADPNKDAKLAQAREDAKKGLIKLPESIQSGSPVWFRAMSNLTSI